MHFMCIKDQIVDHKALKNKDSKHLGYKKYESVRSTLVKRNKEYKTIFEEEGNGYENKY